MLNPNLHIEDTFLSGLHGVPVIANAHHISASLGPSILCFSWLNNLYVYTFMLPTCSQNGQKLPFTTEICSCLSDMATVRSP